MVFKTNRKNQTSSLVKLFCLLGTFILTGVWVMLQNDIRMASVQFFEPEFFTAKPAEMSKYFLVNTEGCRIPMMDPFDPSILSYLLFNQSEADDDERPIECIPPGQQPHQFSLVKSNLTHIFIDDSCLLEWNLTSPPYCCYEPFWRKNFSVSDVTKMSSSVDGLFETAGVCTYFGRSAHMGEHEFVKVECYPEGIKNEQKNKMFYKDFFSFAPTKKKKSASSRNLTKLDGYDQWSVLILGVDAVSRMNLYRQMPRTLDYVKNYLKAVEMFGFNKVGDNTFPNLVPVLTGQSTEELKDICWPSEYTYFDQCLFIWNEFERAGYKTLFAEDATWMGIFSYGKAGFLTQPTDYYWKVFNERAEREIGSDKRLNAKLCTGYRTTLQTLLEYGEKVTTSLAKEPFFGLLWGASMSHDFLNLPRYGDEIHREFLQNLDKNGVLDNCVLVFMSDHGIRWGGIRSTNQGHLEERLPFLFLAFPKRFRKKYPTALGYLRANAHRLTTPFDLHEVLSDLLNADERLNTANLKRRIQSLTKNGPKRGISLFLPVPLNRTCDDAGITKHWCTCSQASEISVKDTDVIHAAFHLINYINGLLKDQSRQCATLMLKEIISASVEQSNIPRTKREITKRVGPQDFLITIAAQPGNGHFEATVRKHMNGSFITMGAVSRTNVYGNQSACITNYRLKLYCYCINYKPT